MLTERILRALEVLGSDDNAGGTMREQASSYIGEPVDDEVLAYLDSSARTIFETTMMQAAKKRYAPEAAMRAALVNTLIGGIAIGKRLGIEDGERFAREIPDVD